VPTYAYACSSCEHAFDVQQSFSDAALTVCPRCERESLRKVFSPVGVVFKGSGFYRTDSRAAAKKKESAAAGSAAGPASGSDATTTSTPAAAGGTGGGGSSSAGSAAASA
jgi:putative FmdB family regulatory protein